MMRDSLTLNEYCWAVARIDPNDGRGYHDTYFTDHQKADAAARKCDGKVVQVPLWKDGQGNYYVISQKRVPVDIPDRNDVLAKLTPAERESLGLR